MHPHSPTKTSKKAFFNSTPSIGLCDRRNDLVHSSTICGERRTVIRAHDRESDRLAAASHQVSAQRARLSQRSRLGEDFAVEHSLLEAGREGAIHSAHGKRSTKCLAPALPCRVGK